MKTIIIALLFSIQSFAATDEAAKDQAVVDELICPAQGEKFVNLSKKTYSAMMDILLSYETHKKQISEFYLTTLEMKKTNPDHVDTIRKMKEVKSGQNQKIVRAKEIYNEQVLALSTEIPKTKRCWKYHTADAKPTVEKYLNAFQTKKVLNKFKDCLRSQATLISEHEKKWELSVSFFNQSISRYSLLSEVKKVDARLTYREKFTNKQCEQMLESGFNADFMSDPSLRPKLAPETKPNPNKVPKILIPSFPEPSF